MSPALVKKIPTPELDAQLRQLDAEMSAPMGAESRKWTLRTQQLVLAQLAERAPATPEALALREQLTAARSALNAAVAAQDKPRVSEAYTRVTTISRKLAALAIDADRAERARVAAQRRRERVDIPDVKEADIPHVRLVSSRRDLAQNTLFDAAPSGARK